MASGDADPTLMSLLLLHLYICNIGVVRKGSNVDTLYYFIPCCNQAHRPV